MENSVQFEHHRDPFQYKLPSNLKREPIRLRPQQFPHPLPGQRQLRAHTYKDDAIARPKCQAEYKQQSQALERAVTRESFLADFFS